MRTNENTAEQLVRYHEREADVYNAKAAAALSKGQTYYYRRALTRAAQHLRWSQLARRLLTSRA